MGCCLSCLRWCVEVVADLLRRCCPEPEAEHQAPSENSPSAADSSAMLEGPSISDTPASTADPSTTEMEDPDPSERSAASPATPPVTPHSPNSPSTNTTSSSTRAVPPAAIVNSPTNTGTEDAEQELWTVGRWLDCRRDTPKRNYLIGVWKTELVDPSSLAELKLEPRCSCQDFPGWEAFPDRIVNLPCQDAVLCNRCDMDACMGSFGRLLDEALDRGEAKETDAIDLQFIERLWGDKVLCPKCSLSVAKRVRIRTAAGAIPHSRQCRKPLS